LHLSHNKIQDLGPLAGITRLSSLNVSNNQIKNVEPLKGMTELKYTMLQKNEISNIATLVEMAQADATGPKRFAPYWQLYLKDNPLDEASQNEHLEALKKIHVRVNLTQD